MNVIQHVTITVVVTGLLPVCVETHGTGGQGSYITVRVGKVLIWLRDQSAAREYVQTWLKGAPAEAGLYLPPERDLIVDPKADYTPAIAITGSALDLHKAGYDRVHGELIVRIGNVTWVVRDKPTLDAHVQAWRQVSDLAPRFLPKKTRR